MVGRPIIRAVNKIGDIEVKVQKHYLLFLFCIFCLHLYSIVYSPSIVCLYFSCYVLSLSANFYSNILFYADNSIGPHRIFYLFSNIVYNLTDKVLPVPNFWNYVVPKLNKFHSIRERSLHVSVIFHFQDYCVRVRIAPFRKLFCECLFPFDFCSSLFALIRVLFGRPYTLLLCVVQLN